METEVLFDHEETRIALYLVPASWIWKTFRSDQLFFGWSCLRLAPGDFSDSGHRVAIKGNAANTLVKIRKTKLSESLDGPELYSSAQEKP
jgi:hypothetical protein